MAKTIVPPALPIAPGQFTFEQRAYIDGMNRVLGLYFRQLHSPHAWDIATLRLLSTPVSGYGLLEGETYTNDGFLRVVGPIDAFAPTFVMTMAVGSVGTVIS